MKAFLRKNTYNSSIQMKTLLILIFVPSDIILGMFMRISHNHAGYVVPFSFFKHRDRLFSDIISNCYVAL